MTKLFFKGAAYVVVAYLLAELLILELHVPWADIPYTEVGLVELFQTFILVCILVLLCVKARRDTGFRELSVCMAIVFGILLIRENDHGLDLLLAHGSWKYFAVVPMIFGAWYFWTNRAVIETQLVRYSRSPGFGFLLAGLVVLVYSRMFGRSIYWQAVMGEDYLRVVKNAAEEGVELLALAILLAATVEFLPLEERSARSSDVR